MLRSRENSQEDESNFVICALHQHAIALGLCASSEHEDAWKAKLRKDPHVKDLLSARLKIRDLPRLLHRKREGDDGDKVLPLLLLVDELNKIKDDPYLEKLMAYLKHAFKAASTPVIPILAGTFGDAFHDRFAPSSWSARDVPLRPLNAEMAEAIVDEFFAKNSWKDWRLYPALRSSLVQVYSLPRFLQHWLSLLGNASGGLKSHRETLDNFAGMPVSETQFKTHDDRLHQHLQGMHHQLQKDLVAYQPNQTEVCGPALETLWLREPLVAPSNISSDPDNPVVIQDLLNKGMCYLHAGRLELLLFFLERWMQMAEWPPSAKRDAKKLLQLDPGNTPQQRGAWWEEFTAYFVAIKMGSYRDRELTVRRLFGDLDGKRSSLYDYDAIDQVGFCDETGASESESVLFCKAAEDGESSANRQIAPADHIFLIDSRWPSLHTCNHHWPQKSAFKAEHGGTARLTSGRVYFNARGAAFADSFIRCTLRDPYTRSCVPGIVAIKNKRLSNDIDAQGIIDEHEKNLEALGEKAKGKEDIGQNDDEDVAFDPRKHLVTIIVVWRDIRPEVREKVERKYPGGVLYVAGQKHIERFFGQALSQLAKDRSFESTLNTIGKKELKRVLKDDRVAEDFLKARREQPQRCFTSMDAPKEFLQDRRIQETTIADLERRGV